MTTPFGTALERARRRVSSRWQEYRLASTASESAFAHSAGLACKVGSWWHRPHRPRRRSTSKFHSASDEAAEQGDEADEAWRTSELRSLSPVFDRLQSIPAAAVLSEP